MYDEAFGVAVPAGEVALVIVLPAGAATTTGAPETGSAEVLRTMIREG